jgi:hypothetical protein
MTTKEHLTLKDNNVHITVKKSNGEIEEFDYSNLFVTAGLDAVANMISGLATVKPFKYMQIGTSSTASTTGMTSLIAEVESTTNSIKLGTTNVSLDTIKYTGTFAISTSYALKEAGLFNNVPTGTTVVMLARITYPVINLGANSTMIINWSVVV